MKKITISQKEYKQLKKKEAIADDLILQLEASLRDLESGKIKQTLMYHM